MSTKTAKKSDKAAIAANKPKNTPVEDPNNPKPKANQGPTVKPSKSAGKPVYDRPSQRVGERFEHSDVVFFREGPAGEIKALPKHEADERLVVIKSTESIFKDSKTVTTLELEGGDKVTIDGIQTIVTPKKGPANTDGPSLNVHHADTQG